MYLLNVDLPDKTLQIKVTKALEVASISNKANIKNILAKLEHDGYIYKSGSYPNGIEVLSIEKIDTHFYEAIFKDLLTTN